ncbi:hypothetical protein AN964_22950 [Heyndrickxia shackletonii]|uniref:CbrC family protein n=1 Tax=Heyndrickxia shackletonii TaxID=157838 RepID=A0A0Q3WRE8_9BACI|nr:hypothetical protein AN964_22950 [Heyndrickxia shackletonii]NEY98179.1 CbrC family protein [Heyndrickxia shackletonii]
MWIYLKYNPNALFLGVIIKEKTSCPVCKKEREYMYEGPFYAEDNVEGICPWCILDGSATKKYDGEFQDVDSCEEVDKQEYIDELIHRTPGYVGWQQEYWLSHCGDFCAIVQYVGWEEIKHFENELAEDIKKICTEYGLTKQGFQNGLKNEGNLQGYLFECIYCGKHRLLVDSN